MNEKKFAEEFGKINSSFIDEALDYKPENKRGGIYMSKKKLVTIAIAAVLVVAIGATTAVASWSRLNQLSDYFDGMKDTFRIPEEVPIMNDPEVYGKEVNTNVTTAASDDAEPVIQAAEANSYTPPAPGTAQITTVSATAHSIVMTVEFNAEGLDIPAELPEDARHDEEYHFNWVQISGFEFGGVSGLNTTISREGDIFTFVYRRNTIFGFPKDEIVLTLKNFGYINADKETVIMRDIEVEVHLPVDEIDFMESLYSKNTAEIMGTEFSAELSAYEFIVYADRDSYISNYDDIYDYFWDNNSVIEFHMLDGTDFIDHYFTNDYGASHMITRVKGFGDDEHGTSGIVLSFEVPLDISQIDYIVLNGYRFDFASAE